MTRWILLIVMAAGSLARGAAEKLNVLFIVVDDLRPAIGCYGDPLAVTPNLDALAKRGLVFERAYCQQALCSPSRTSLLTGLRPDSTKVYDLKTHFRNTIPDVVTLPQIFKNKGWESVGFGKIYHGGLNDAASWSVPWTANMKPQYGDAKVLAHLKAIGADPAEQGGKTKGPPVEISAVGDDDLPDGYVSQKAVEALRQVKDEPFFLAVGLVKPHLPFVAPKKYFDLHPIEKFKLPANDKPPKGMPKVALVDFGELRAYGGVTKHGPLSEDEALKLIQGYYASASYADAMLGRVLDELDRLKLREKTIVIVWGDHGWHLGEQGHWTKHTNFEVAARAPLIISVPGMKHPGETTRALVEFVDVYPTLCELAGIKPPAGLEGMSFVPVMDEPGRAWKTAAFSQFPRNGGSVMGYTMRTDRWRYTEWREGGHVMARELYDEQEDPGETVNVESQKPELVKQLAEQMAKGWKGAEPVR